MSNTLESSVSTSVGNSDAQRAVLIAADDLAEIYRVSIEASES